MNRAIGPYRLDERLGVGGMGEVWAGYDERLDRPVALKRLRPERLHPDQDRRADARERFRREARAVARLRHPAIVQVYDWIEDEGGDWIVMEHVDGRSLRAHLGGGALPARRALEIARDVASVLQAAHGAGIIHRDLKAENVMLTGDGQTGDGEVRVLDFGLAKQTASSDGTPLSTLSTDGQILGTASTMAPEQAMGYAVDARADLFSLGVLLYEMLTGANPFAAAGPVETLARLCTTREEPAHERNPAVPLAVSRLVGRLLEKEPSRRPQSADEVFGTLTALLAQPESFVDTERITARDLGTPLPIDQQSTTTVPTAGPWTPSPSEPTVSVDDPERPPRAPRTLWIVAAVASTAILLAIGMRLLAPAAPPGEMNASAETATGPLLVAVLETEIVDDTTGEQAPSPRRLQAGAIRAGAERALLTVDGARIVPPARGGAVEDPVRLARAVGAGEALVSRLECEADVCQVVLQRIRETDGVLLWSDRFTPASSNLLNLSLEVSDRVRGTYAELGSLDEMNTPSVSDEDFVAFLALRDAEQRGGDDTSASTLLTGLEAIQQSSPRFLDAHLLEASLLRKAFIETRRREDAERALAAVARARALRPGDPRMLKTLATLLRDLGRDEEALPVLEELERLEPGDADVLYIRARRLEKEGHRDQALELMREAVRRQPSWNLYSNLADMSYRAGELDGARAALEAMLERTPDVFSGRSRLAQLELLSGSPERAAELYGELVEERPGETELTNLGVAHLLLGRAADAADAFRRALESAPDSPYALLNLADAELLRGAEDAAATLYSATIEAIDRDPNPDALATVRAQALAHLGRVEEAVGAVQGAVRRAPDNPQIAYEAALVYALVGEETSALLEARRALDGGVDRRWFAFAWFDDLRERL